jgi:excinuclease UvrABC nuclease subunit
LGHFVYIYRDLRGRVLYVGYGANSGRGASHQSGSHNPELDAYLRTSAYRAEISGPFGSEEMGRAVETALISALDPRFNRAEGATKHRFRPLGVPENFSERIAWIS